MLFCGDIIIFLFDKITYYSKDNGVRSITGVDYSAEMLNESRHKINDYPLDMPVYIAAL